MAYWGNKAEECDYAFDSLGSYIAHIRDSMFAAAAGTIDERYTEQTIVMTLKVIRTLWSSFPRSVSCTFHRGDFDKSKALFSQWFTVVGPKLSASRKRAITAEAEQVFKACEEMYR
jgi:hypothetical protein